MDVRMEALDPEKLTVKVSIVMPLGHWRQLAEQLDNGVWPSCDLLRAVRGTIKKYEQTVFAPD